MEKAKEQRLRGGPSHSSKAQASGTLKKSSHHPDEKENGNHNNNNSNGSGSAPDDFGISISGTATGIGKDEQAAAAVGGETNEGGKDPDLYNTFLLKPIPDFGNSALSDLAAVITRDIYVKSPNVTWDDISGLSQAKQLLKEAVVFPHKFPHLFKVSETLVRFTAPSSWPPRSLYRSLGPSVAF